MFDLLVTCVIRINKFLKTDFTIKINVAEKQRRFDRSTVIVNLKNANEIMSKNLKYLHRNNTRNWGKTDKKRQGERKNIKSESIR